MCVRYLLGSDGDNCFQCSGFFFSPPFHNAQGLFRRGVEDFVLETGKPKFLVLVFDTSHSRRSPSLRPSGAGAVGPAVASRWLGAGKGREAGAWACGPGRVGVGGLSGVGSGVGVAGTLCRVAGPAPACVCEGIDLRAPAGPKWTFHRGPGRGSLGPPGPGKQGRRRLPYLPRPSPSPLTR